MGVFTAFGMDLSLLLRSLIVQDLNKKPKYLVTFTVGFDQRKNIDAAVKKVIYMEYCSYSSYYHAVEAHACSCCISSLMTSQFYFFTMTVGLLSGISMSGQRMQFISVSRSKQNGRYIDNLYDLCFFILCNICCKWNPIIYCI